MAKLYFKNAQHFENPTRMIFKESAGSELFVESSQDVKKVGEWIDEKGSSTEQAKALAESVAKQEEQIREGTNEQLLNLYVDVFTEVIGAKESYSMPSLTVDDTYDKKGVLAILEDKITELRVAFGGTPDLRLLAYATVYKNFKSQGLDANYLPKGATVVVANGEVTVTYTENGVVKTATSEIFPWSTATEAHANWLKIQEQKSAVEQARLDREGRPGFDIDGDGVDDIAAEPPAGEKTAEETPAPQPAPIEDAPVPPATVPPEVTPPVVAPTEVPLAAVHAEGEGIATGRAIDEQKTPAESKEAEVPPTEMEKDWLRVMAAQQAMRKADKRALSIVEEMEANEGRNDKMLKIEGAQGQVFFMVSVKDRLDPSVVSYKDTKALWTTAVLIMGNGKEGNDVLQEKVHAWLEANDYQIPSVEEAIVDLTMIVSGETPPVRVGGGISIEYTPGSGLFEGSSVPRVKKERAPEVTLRAPSEIPAALGNYPYEMANIVNALMREHSGLVGTVPVEGATLVSKEQIKLPGFDVPAGQSSYDGVPGYTLGNIQAGYLEYVVKVDVRNNGMNETRTLQARADVTEVDVQKYIDANGGTLPDGVSRDQVKAYLAWVEAQNALAEQVSTLDYELSRTERGARLDALEKAREKARDERQAARRARLESGEPSGKKAELEAAMDLLYKEPFGTNEQRNAQYELMIDNLLDTRVRALDHVRGAEAAWKLGNVEEAKLRYERALRNVGDNSTDKDSITDNLEDIKATYGRAVIVMPTNSVLTYTGTPLTSEYRNNAIAYAQARISATSRFEGYLPVGTYAINGRPFTVNAEGTAIYGVETANVETTNVETAEAPNPVATNLNAYAMETTRDAYVNALATLYIGNPPFLTELHRSIPVVNADGSAVWKMEYTRADKKADVIVRAETEAISEKAITEFLAANTGVTREKAVQYLGYKAIMAAYTAEWAKTSEKLGADYRAWTTAQKATDAAQ